MWLSERFAGNRSAFDAGIGEVTISGGGAVSTNREQRMLQLCSPGGYFWKPEVGKQVVVLKCGNDGEAVMGALNEKMNDLNCGEICIKSKNASIILRNNGEIDLYGNIKINGGLTVNGNEIV